MSSEPNLNDPASGVRPPPGGDTPMDESVIHLAILEALADGVHPFLGQAFPEDDLMRNPRVRESIAAGMAALEKQVARLEQRKKLPGKTGSRGAKTRSKAWSKALRRGGTLRNWHESTDGRTGRSSRDYPSWAK